jgi:hypothetical protein
MIYKSTFIYLYQRTKHTKVDKSDEHEHGGGDDDNTDVRKKKISFKLHSA